MAEHLAPGPGTREPRGDARAVAPDPREETVERIVAAARAPRAGTTTVVAVDGPAGSGKTTLAGLIGRRLGARVVHMDDLYEGWSGLLPAGDVLADQVLAPLARGRAGSYRRYDWEAGELAEWHEVPVTDHLVVEGVGCVRAASVPYLSVIVWVEADDELRLARGLARDGADAEDQWRTWMTEERELFDRERTRDLADVRVDAWGRLQS